MNPVSLSKFSCPCCEVDFESAVRTSAATPGLTTTDFFTMAAGEQSIHHQVHTCPGCGFSFEEMEEGELRDDVRRFVCEVITPQLPNEGDLPSWKKYEFLALIDEILGASPYSVGMTYLHAAWCCYDLKQQDCETLYRKRAIYHFHRELESQDMDDELIYLVPYLLAEQYRRTGDTQEASRWYDLVMEMDQDHPDSGLFITLAAQQKVDPREFMGEIIHEDQ